MSASMHDVVGVDIGTDNVRLCYVKDNNILLRSCPAHVAFDGDEIVIGEEAKRCFDVNHVYNLKCLLGRTYSGAKEALGAQPNFDLVQLSDRPYIRVQSAHSMKFLLVEDLLSMIVSKLKNDMNVDTGPLSRAVVTWPGYFADTQRTSIRLVVENAGLRLTRVTTDSSSALIGYRVDEKYKTSQKSHRILVLDIGASFNINVVSFEEDCPETTYSSQSANLGGNALTKRIVDHVHNQFKLQYKKSLSDNSSALQKLALTCEEVKHKLSFEEDAFGEVANLIDNVDYGVGLNREGFNNLCSDLFQAMVGFIDETLLHAKCSKSEVSDILLVGGSVAIPKIQEVIRQFFGQTANIIVDDNPSTINVRGAAMIAERISYF